MENDWGYPHLRKPPYSGGHKTSGFAAKEIAIEATGERQK